MSIFAPRAASSARFLICSSFHNDFSNRIARFYETRRFESFVSVL